MSNQNKYFFVKDYGDSIIEQLNAIIGKTFPELEVKVQVKESNHEKHGDYQFDKCNQIVRQHHSQIQCKNVSQIAHKIVDAIEQCPLVEKYEVINGFINIFLSKTYLGRKMFEICTKGFSLPKIGKKHVVVDYSSPNIAKQMHPGHLRSTIIGDSICRLLEDFGFSVLRLNHIGDWGTQFGMLIVYLRDELPNFLNEPPNLEELQSYYKRSNERFKEDPEFKARALKCVVQLQNEEEPEIVKAWQLICEISRKDNEQIYKRLDIKFGEPGGLIERGESFYQSRMQKLVPELEEANVLTVKEGRKLLFVGDEKLTIEKSDGGFGYDTSDMAALKQRLMEEKADWIIYVVGMDQTEHLKTVFAAGRQLGWYDPNQKRIEHIQFGLVLGEDKKKLKSRSGTTIKLLDLLDEGFNRAKNKLKDRNFLEDELKDTELKNAELTNAAEALAYGSIKYADLAQSRISDYVFSFDRMLEDRGNTAVYLLYAYSRIRSIARKAKIGKEQFIGYLEGLNDGLLPLEHPKEIRLAKQIVKFPDCMLQMLDTLQLNKACEYIYELATIFSDFYNECQVVVRKLDGNGKDDESETIVDFNRLTLCEATGNVMLRCFHILGIRPIERM